jgi:hypothetical protein
MDKVLVRARVDEAFVGGRGGPDLALVEIEDSSVDLATLELARVDRNSATAEPVEGCHAVGFPQFTERPTRPVVRDTVDAWGHIPVLSKLDGGLLTVQVTAAPRPLPPEDTVLGRSEWSGMSGAPVIADGCLVGVVSEHAPREGPSAITAVPLTSLEPDPAHPRWGTGVGNAPEWWARLGVAGREGLRTLPRVRTRPEPAYRATVHAIQERTPQLLGRGSELAELADFATGTDGYRWLTGAVWAGKTALAAEAVMATLPPSVDAVAYFLSPGEADADSSRFLAAVVPQLAYILDVDTPVIDLHQFRDLWYRAAKRAADTGRHLFLVVDGLDEDLRPQGLPSVASLLPAHAAVNAHLLVTSRSCADVDLPEGHPLRAKTQVVLEASPYTPHPIPPKLAALIGSRLLPADGVRALHFAGPDSESSRIVKKLSERHRLDSGEKLIVFWRLGSSLPWGSSDSIAFTASKIRVASRGAFSIPYSRFAEFTFEYHRESVMRPRQGQEITYWLSISGPGVDWSSPGFGPYRLYEPMIISNWLNAIKGLIVIHAEKALRSPDS